MAIDLPREIALKTIYDINEKGAYSNIALSKQLESNTLKDVDRAFVTDLVYGTIKWKLTIDYIISNFSSTKLKKISPWILNVLRLGVYQILYMDRIPESAACNESVKLSKKYGHAASSGFVNGILRNIARKKNSISYPDKQKDPVLYLSVKYSHPDWLVNEWINNFGVEFTESLLISNNEVPDFTIRVNTLKTTKEELISNFRESGLEASEGRAVDEALVLKNPGSFLKLDVYKAGHFQVQDESSMLPSKILDPKPGELVIDVCSAPGGKTTHMAQLMNNKGSIIARDIHEHKISLINEASERLGISIIKAQVYDALMVDESLVEKADRVLVDAPCTGYGIIRKKPDIKWSRTMSDLKEITELQLKILSAASKYVKPGGFIVYSTCTIGKEENRDLVERFLTNNKEFDFCGFNELLPEVLREYSGNGYIEIYPNINKIDGFFIAKMRKRG
ncbi:MAG TPA: 16S rRNA (cytosine(967)-C(5))-methyltransferase RsmB [Pseudobacteroides sp.]|uniref:16S rRNA (cytosine(967)-C(5))-methyltransferase RsmB n=1 Tax=Pseudobacteroides sp. TaxID=1968840 RepID=UPI002F95E26D